jgi:hypothetical protein
MIEWMSREKPWKAGPYFFPYHSDYGLFITSEDLPYFFFGNRLQTSSLAFQNKLKLAKLTVEFHKELKTWIHCTQTNRIADKDVIDA